MLNCCDSQYTKLSVEPSMDSNFDRSIFDRINAREQAAKERGDNQRRLKATAEEKNEEAFDCFLNKVSFFPKTTVMLLSTSLTVAS